MLSALCGMKCNCPAASVMYEFATELSRQIPGVKGLQRQAKCLLAAMNALRLGDPRYIWILKPIRSGFDGCHDDQLDLGDDSSDDGESVASPPKKSRIRSFEDSDDMDADEVCLFGDQLSANFSFCLLMF